VCGIAAFMSHQPRSGSPSTIAGTVRQMQAVMHRRGPDGSGLKVWPGMGLGFQRLAIRDLAGGHQPMTGEDGQVWSVLNGEIYNYPELRCRLEQQGHRFQTDCDAELIPHLYEAVGLDELLTELRGMFALAIYDVATDTLHVARDPFGIKPLYVAEGSHSTAVASQAEALLAAGVDDAIDPTSLWHYLTYQYVPGPRTMWRDIQQVKPGHRVSYHRGQRDERRYGHLSFDPDPDWTAERAAAELRAALADSVARHLAADVPVGAYLSGGVDSSAIVALMRQHQPVHTFAIGFDGATADRDERARARRTAGALATTHHEIVVGARDYRDAWEAIVRAQGDPLADPSAPALYFLAEEARQHVKVVLSGEGADELFCGYAIYHEPLSLAPLEWLPPRVARAAHGWAERLPAGVLGRGYLDRATTPLPERFLGNARIFSENEKTAWWNLADPSGDSHPNQPLPPSWLLTRDVYQETAHLPAPTRMQTVDLRFWLAGNILMKSDKMSMAHSLEQRVPYLDAEVFKVAARIPWNLQMSGGAFKRVLRAAVADLLPTEIVHQPKLGFPVPLGHWLRGDLLPIARELVETSQDSYLRRGPLRALLTAPQRTRVEDRKLWTALTYLMWHRVFVEGRQAVASGGAFIGEPEPAR